MKYETNLINLYSGLDRSLKVKHDTNTTVNMNDLKIRYGRSTTPNMNKLEFYELNSHHISATSRQNYHLILMFEHLGKKDFCQGFQKTKTRSQFN